MNRAEIELVQELGREPTPSEIAERLDWTERDVTDMQGYLNKPVSLEKPVGEEEGTELKDMIPNPDGADPSEDLHASTRRDQLREAVANLPSRERDVIELRYGLTGEGWLTLDAVGKRVGVTRERIRQIEAMALERLLMAPETQSLKADAE